MSAFFYPTKRGARQAGKYSIIGISCALLDLGVLNGLLLLYPTQQTLLLGVFNTLAYTAAILNSYYWNTRYTFRVDKGKRQFAGFLIQALVSLFIANGVFLFGFHVLLPMTGLPLWLDTNIAKGASMLASSTASFFFMKYFVFRA
ncbi:GtrA family protein [Alkalicoccus urumqiensis]|uniref:GtrA family protein n=1 Tax=Alkalicoccus urumqiensis TaxID=1548213 RepID=A0A2P6MJU5_ALKUR|nr:GtrA family protein [Alkalicoccus urumqiensis]PRO66560.1 GtrA family protein [Alkalicoccus urumqiensis]